MTTDFLPLQDYKKLFPYLSYDNYLALTISLETGLRIGDVVSLPSEALNGRELSFTAAKTGKSGKVQISKGLAEKLHRFKGSRFIFESYSKAGHRTRQAVWHDVKKAAALAGIELNVAPHSARKTFAVKVAKEKGFAAAQRALQHDNPCTTVGYVYSGLFTEANSKASAALTADELETLAEMIADKVAERLPCVKGCVATCKALDTK